MLLVETVRSFPSSSLVILCNLQQNSSVDITLDKTECEVQNRSTGFLIVFIDRCNVTVMRFGGGMGYDVSVDRETCGQTDRPIYRSCAISV